MLRKISFLLSIFAVPVLSTPSGLHALRPRAAADNIVYVTDENKFCLIAPRDPHTDIGDSEHPGGMKTHCSPQGRYDDSQGQLPPDFWTNVAFTTGNGRNGGRFAQLTGCIDPTNFDRLNPEDAGGQYDSSGGAGHQGNPQGSACLGYNHYVELLEPGGFRGCIKCCDDPADCPTGRSTLGCPNVIPGNYFDCA